MKNHSVKKLTISALICAIAYIFVFISPIKVQFLSFEPKGAIITLGALVLGPLYGVGISLVTALLELLTISSTGFYGFIMNFLGNAAFSFTAGIIYKYRRNIKGAILGLAGAALVMTAVMILANVFITPLYMGAPREAVISMIPTLLLPFNLAKAVLNSGIILLLYKPFSMGIRRIGFGGNKEHKVKGNVTLWVVLSALVLILTSIVVFFVFLKGSIGF